jgi:hypothetical protein
MDNLDQFRGAYESRMNDLEVLRQVVIDGARPYIPNSPEVLLEEGEDANSEYPLAWVKVADPTGGPDACLLDVLPVIGGITTCDGEAGTSVEMGSITLIGKLPNGEEREMGAIINLAPRYFGPKLCLCYGEGRDGYRVVGWDTTDAETFLKLAESAFAAQAAL